MSRIRADKFVNSGATGAPQLTFGAEVPVGYGITGAGFINVSGVSTFSGNVSIAGTLTYEDVTNIDSVGIITARSGIIATGVVTATSFSGDGSNLSGIDGTLDTWLYGGG